MQINSIQLKSKCQMNIRFYSEMFLIGQIPSAPDILAFYFESISNPGYMAFETRYYSLPISQ